MYNNGLLGDGNGMKMIVAIVGKLRDSYNPIFRGLLSTNQLTKVLVMTQLLKL